MEANEGILVIIRSFFSSMGSIIRLAIANFVLEAFYISLWKVGYIKLVVLWGFLS